MGCKSISNGFHFYTLFKRKMEQSLVKENTKQCFTQWESSFGACSHISSPQEKNGSHCRSLDVLYCFLQEFLGGHGGPLLSTCLFIRIVIYSHQQHPHTKLNEPKCIRCGRIGQRLCESVNQERIIVHCCGEEGGVRTACEGSELTLTRTGWISMQVAFKLTPTVCGYAAYSPGPRSKHWEVHCC